MAFILRGPSSVLNIANVSNLVTRTIENYIANGSSSRWIRLRDWKPSDFLDYEVIERKLIEANYRDNSEETRQLIRSLARQESQLKQIASQGVMFGLTITLGGDNIYGCDRNIIDTNILDRSALYDFSTGQFIPSINKEFLIFSSRTESYSQDMFSQQDSFNQYKLKHDNYLNIALQETQRRLSGAPSNAAVGIMTNFSR